MGKDGGGPGGASPQGLVKYVSEPVLLGFGQFAGHFDAERVAVDRQSHISAPVVK